jgi:hypothetical protein
VNHRHRKVLQSLFAHPVSANIDPRAVHAALEALGAEVAHGGHGRIQVTLNGQSHGFHDTRHALSKEEVVETRRFLESCGVDPMHYPA